MKKNQNKVVPQGLGNRVAAESTGKQDEERRPGSAISREFQPNKQQKVLQKWKRNDSEDNSVKEGNSNQQAVNTPFGYVPFKSAPVPIYGNRANPNGSPEVVRNAAVANYMQNAYQPSPQLPRPDSVMTASTRPGSELGIYRVPSRYQSYTTLPRPEHTHLDVNDLAHAHAHAHMQQQQPVYGSMLPKAVVSHTRTGSMEHNSLYGTTEKRPVSQVSGSKSLHTLHTEFGPRVGSKNALSVYGMHYEDESMRALKSTVAWDTNSLIFMLQIITGVTLFILGVLRVFDDSLKSHGYEIPFGVFAALNGIVGVFAVWHKNFSFLTAMYVFAFANLFLSAVPFYIGALPFLSASDTRATNALGLSPEQIAFYELNKRTGGDPTNLDVFLMLVSGFVFFVSLIIVSVGCHTFGKMLRHVENMRLHNAINKSVKDMRDMVLPA